MLQTFRLPELKTVWNHSQGFDRPFDRWTAYCNQLAIAVVIPFLQEVAAPAFVKSWLSAAAQASQWSCVTGTVLRVGSARWLVLPTEQIDEDDFEIPQEWLDIPDWQIDRIVAVAIDPDEMTARIIGFSDRATVKSDGRYNPISRTYQLNQDFWIADFATMAVIADLGQDLGRDTRDSRDLIEPNQRSVLDPLQAQNLIPRLAEAVIPRLALPFVTWAALIENPGWRQQFHQLRQTGEMPRSISQWLRSGLDSFTADLGWQPMSVAMAGTRSAVSMGASSGVSRALTISGLRYELRISIGSEVGEWRFEMQCLDGDRQIPKGFILRLLTEDLQGFEGNEAIAAEPVNALWIDVVLEEGDGLVWEIEPTPEEGDRELLRF